MEIGSIVTVSWWAILPLVVVGSLLHFAYDWSRHHRAVAVFAAVNESYWEHVKIAAWPSIALYAALFALGGYRHAAFVPAAAVALYSIPVSMVGMVFLYKALASRNVLWLDIALFAAAIALAQANFVLVLTHLRPDTAMVVIAACYLVGILVAYTRFTLRPPREPDLFVDPLTHRYGLAAHPDGPGSPGGADGAGDGPVAVTPPSR